MKPFSDALGALFDTNQFVSGDLYSFALPAGGSAYVTSADTNLAWEGQTYLSGAPRLDRSSISQKTGLQVSSVKIVVYPTSSDTIGGLTWLSALRRGYFDGATVTIARAFAPNWTQPITGTILMLSGRVADATFGRSKASIEVNSWTELLSNTMPRTYYQSGCNNTLGDARCGFNVAGSALGGTITYAASASNIATSCAAPPNWITYGRIEMLTGVCAGEKRSVGFNSGPTEIGNEIQLQSPLSATPNIGDEFVVYPGCDKDHEHLPRSSSAIWHVFTGYPFIPAPEVAV